MSKKIFSFGKQLKLGELGEKFFMKCYKNLKPKKSNNREADIIINDGETVELKSDSYPESKTENFFIEIVGNTVSGKLGGAHLSLHNNINYFVYHFVNDKTFYWFKPKELVEFIDLNKEKFKIREIRNVAWSSVGLLVPRSSIEHLLIRKDSFNEK